MTHEPQQASTKATDQAKSDGRAAIAITLLAVVLIAFLISRII